MCACALWILSYFVCTYDQYIWHTQDMSKLLYDRALSYLNIDIAVYGHDHVRILATPLLYNAIYTATKMVSVKNSCVMSLSHGLDL